MKRKLTTLLTALALVGNTWADGQTFRVDAEYYLMRFYQKEYIANYKIDPIDYTSSGDRDGKPIRYAFDSDWLNVWQAASHDSEQSITVTFGSQERVSKIITGLRERNPLQKGDGYPQTIEVHVSQSESGNDFDYKFALRSSWSKEKLMFIFPEAVEAKRIKLVFKDIFSSGIVKQSAEVAELIFLKDDPAMDHALKMFDDKDMMQLNENYRDDALLDSLKTIIGDHLAKGFITERIQRAQDLLQGRIDADSFPYPVKVYQKTGPDTEKYVMAFFAEKYTVFEEEKFYADVSSHIETMFAYYEPFRSIRDKFNIYLIFTPSNQTSQRGFDTIDSKYSTYIGATNDGGTRLTLFSHDGKDVANNMIREFSQKYLENGTMPHCTNFVVNTASYGGAGHRFVNNIGGALYTVGAGPDVLVHELGHAVADLGDEYCYTLEECTNLTAESDGYKSRWAEFMGFRNTRHVQMCYGYYRPSSTCIMEYFSYDFCEVCKLGLFEAVNDIVKDKEQWYMADPVVYIDHTTLYPQQINKDNIHYANGKQLQFRTVMKNLSEKAQTVVAEFMVTSQDGNQIRCQSTEEHTIGPDELKSVTATTPEATSGLTSGDRIVARIKDKDTGKVLMDMDTYKADYGYVRNRYLLGNEETTTQHEVAPSRTLNFPAGKVLSVSAPHLYGHTYQHTENGGDITVQKYTTTEVKHYYAKNRGKITLTLLDETGNELQSIERYVAFQEAFRPSQSDFPKREGYTLVLPTEEVVFDGVHDMELTYTLASMETSITDIQGSRYSGIVVMQPNPNNGNFSLSIDNDYSGDMQITCYSTNGTLLHRQRVKKTSGQAVVPVSISNYKGIALVSISCGNKIHTVKAIIR